MMIGGKANGSNPYAANPFTNYRLYFTGPSAPVGSSVTVDYTGCKAGDILLYITFRDLVGTTYGKTGWTSIANIAYGNAHITTHAKVAVGTETTEAFTEAYADKVIVAMIVDGDLYTADLATNANNSNEKEGLNLAVSFNSETTTSENDWILSFAAMNRYSGALGAGSGDVVAMAENNESGEAAFYLGASYPKAIGAYTPSTLTGTGTPTFYWTSTTMLFEKV